MTRWEYMLAVPTEEQRHDMEPWLNSLGREGWEFVQQWGNCNTWVKRPLPETEKE